MFAQRTSKGGASAAKAAVRRHGVRRGPSILPLAGSQDELKPRPTKIFKQRLRAPASRGRPLSDQKQRQGRPAKAGRYKFKDEGEVKNNFNGKTATKLRLAAL